MWWHIRKWLIIVIFTAVVAAPLLIGFHYVGHKYADHEGKSYEVVIYAIAAPFLYAWILFGILYVIGFVIARRG